MFPRVESSDFLGHMHPFFENEDSTIERMCSVAESSFSSYCTLFQGVNPHVRLPDGITPLYQACASGNISIAAQLLALGASPNRANLNASKATPLEAALELGNFELIELLLGYGASLNKRCSEEESPLSLALRLKNEDLLLYLLQKGAVLEDSCAQTLLQQAAELGMSDVVRELCRQGVPPSSGSPSCVFTAAGSDRTEVLKVLLEFADIESVNLPFEGITPLLYAVAMGKYENVELLVERGADLSWLHYGLSFFFFSKFFLERAQKEDEKRVRLAIHNYCVQKLHEKSPFPL